MGGHLADVLKGRVGGHKTASTKKDIGIDDVLYIYIYIYIFIYSYIYGFATYQLTKEIALFDVIYFVHQERDETFLTKPRGTWKGVVVLIVATHRSTQGFRQFDGSLLSCGNIRT